MNVPLTEAEKTAKVEADAKEAEALAEKAKREKIEAETAEKQKQEEAVEAEKADLEKRRVALGLEEGADKEAIEKAEKEIAEKAEKFKQELPSKIEAIAEALKGFEKFVETVGKRFGIKTSMDVDIDKQTKGDPFGSALRG
jgi:colicin import membrane protein